ncbi:MAG: shikimate kinase [Deltaproteobacteria bacterium]|nr:MAG: shikimate kinase [Deltaproteobacteria bacterium]
MNIYLIGYRCTGKSSVGKSLAKILGWSFLDADVELVKEYKIIISEIVATEGWESFRKKEKHVLKRLSSLDKHVIATGGGAILDEENVKNIKKSGVSIWLRATPETVKDRILKDETTEDSRPSLTSKGLMEEIEETLIYRNPFYEKAMDFSVYTDNIDIKNVCLTIQKKLNSMDAL